MRIGFFLLFSLLFINCSDRSLPEGPTSSTQAQIKDHKTPESLNAGKTYLISVFVDNRELAKEVEYISLSIFEEGQTSPARVLELYDDGGAVYPTDGDIIAFDGYFTNHLEWQSDTGEDKDYIFRFEAIAAEGLSLDPYEKTIVSLQNYPPTIIEIVTPDSLPSGFEENILLTATVTDSNGLDDVKNVLFRGIPDDTSFPEFEGELYDNGENGDALSGDGIYSLAIDKTFAIARKGEYELIFQATDKSESKSVEKNTRISIINKAPQLYNLQSLSEVRRPIGDSQTAFLMTISVDDPQTREDINFVRILWQKPDGSFSNNSPFDLFDNGLPFDLQPDKWNNGYRGDEVENDGIYSITGIFDSDDELGDYTITFYAEDFAGNESDSITHIITLK